MIRLHILHHAAKEPIFGLGIIEELGRHGYRLSADTLYPLLHGLERDGYLRSYEKRNGRQARRLYRATAKGHVAFARPKAKFVSSLLNCSKMDDSRWRPIRLLVEN